MLLYGLQTETEKPEIQMTKQSTLSVWKILILEVKSQRGDSASVSMYYGWSKINVTDEIKLYIK